MKALFLIALLLALLTSCATRYFSAAPVEIPDPPALATVSGEELACLSEDAWRRVRLRDRQCRAYAEHLRLLLEATQEIRP